MKKIPAAMMTVLATLLGLALLGTAMLAVTLSHERYRALVVLTLYGGALCMLVLEALLSRRADPDYRPFFSCLFVLLGVGLVMLGLFFSVMWMFLSSFVYAVLLAVFMGLYGLALLMAAGAHHYLAQRVWRPWLYDFFRQLPYIYWRYRI